MSEELTQSEVSTSEQTTVGAAVLREATRQVDLIHFAMFGVSAVLLLLISVLLLPIVGFQPVSHPIVITSLAISAFIGLCVLFYMNYRVHKHVALQARLTEVLVNSLGQGFLKFDQNGMCGLIYSLACHDLLETVPANRSIAEVLRVPEDKRAEFDEIIEMLFTQNHALGFDDLSKFLPKQFPHSDARRRVALAYRPIRRTNGALRQVVLIATDQTEENAAQELAARQQNFADMIYRIFKERNQFKITLKHLRELIADASNPNANLKEVASFLRNLHTLKAAVRHFSMLELGDIIAKLEQELRDKSITTDEAFRACLQAGRDQMKAALDIVMVDAKDLVGDEGELARTTREISDIQLYDFARSMQQRNVAPQIIDDFLDNLVALPIEECFTSFAEDLQQLATMMEKKISPIVFTGTRPRIIMAQLQELFFSLRHIARNIMDHAIEAPVQRLALGKPEAGQVTISSDIQTDAAQQQYLHLTISDDGAGISPELVRRKLSAIDPEGAWRDENDQVVIQRIFSWGFTTREGVTEISGRGVGMEAVEAEVKKLSGTVTVFSKLGQGTRFEIILPYKRELTTASATKLKA